MTKYTRPMGILLLVIATLLPICGWAGGSAGGGGSGIAAEITRATDAFIAAIENNPELFPDVDPKILKNLKPEIFVTGKPIVICQNMGELEAWSDIEEGYSKFNLPSWLKKDELSKIQLAGHERLVLAGLEESNQYDLSNKIFEVRIKDLEKQYGPAQAICKFGETACIYMEESEEAISRIIELLNQAQVTPAGANILIKMQRTMIKSQITSLVGLKQIQLDRKIIKFGNSKKKLSDYENKVSLAFEKHFNPIFEQAKKIIQEKNPNLAQPCIEIK